MVSLFTSISAHGNDVSILQNGYSGTVALELSKQSENLDLTVNQGGIENLLDATFESGITAHINQFGDYGRIDLHTRSGADNRLEINQSGERNTLSGDLSGHSVTGIFHQSGTDNNLDFDLSIGSGNIDVDQAGTNNQTQLSLRGGGFDIGVTQHGAQNIIDMNLSGSNVKLDVEQRGNGETVTIDHY